MKLALFDFDGTITSKDSLVDFIIYAVGRPTYFLGLVLLSPMLITYLLKVIPNQLAKEKLIAHFFMGWSVHKFQRIAKEYSLNEIDKIIRAGAINKIRWHQNHGHQVVIVSASIEYWLKAWCDVNKVELVATQVDVQHDHLSGKFSSKNCYGKEKVNRIKEMYNLDDYDYIYAYGDSRGDAELLKLANEAYYKPFRN